MAGKHRHDYRTSAFWTLSLPDHTGSYDGFLAWTCQICGDQVWSTGYFHPQATAMTPTQWQAAIARERREQTALAVAAQKEERRHVVAWDKYGTFRKTT